MRSKVDISIRFYQPSDDEKIVEFLKNTFPKWADFKDPLGLWRWKYLETPLGSIVTVAENDDKIVGCLHAVLFNAKIGSEFTLLSWEDDLAVDTDFRGLRLWEKMRTLRNEEYQNLVKYKYATSTNPIVRASWIKRNLYLFPFPVTRMMKIKNIDYLLEDNEVGKKQLVKIGINVLIVLNRLSNLFRMPIKQLEEFELTQVLEFDERFDAFWMKIKDDYNFILEKKHNYLNWRFRENDRGNHAIFQATSNDEVIGYMVVGYKAGYKEGMIEDFLTLRDRLDVAEALLEFGCRYLDCLGVETIFYQVVVGHPNQSISRRNGFIDTRKRPYILLDYTADLKEKKIPLLKKTTPRQIQFNYSTTI